MIKNIKYYIADNTVPYKNIAMEEYFLNNVCDGQCIFYLWQNKNTVVIGKNQNAYKECMVNALKNDGGHLVRRLSGGGAVFHDLGNLNFTFLVKEKDYNVDKQLDVIIKGIARLGINAEKTGRNDICADGRKISGNAFYKRRDKCYHHGTILIEADLEKMKKYLNVSADKLKAKAVDSVKSRVTNLKQINMEIDTEAVKKALLEAFNEVYGLQALEIKENEINYEEIKSLEEKFSSETFIYGKNMQGDLSLKERFSWGGIEINLKIKGNKIEDSEICSDAMDWQFAELLEEALKNIVFSREDMTKAVKGIKNALAADIYKDILGLIENCNI